MLRHYSSINRNIVECKALPTCCTCATNTVLIETLWNVKSAKFWLIPSSGGRVLIETLWNVKRETCGCSSIGTSCINRNIVECKVTFFRLSAPALFRINRNIVECKDF